jgi:hypothetical protein
MIMSNRKLILCRLGIKGLHTSNMVKPARLCLWTGYGYCRPMGRGMHMQLPANQVGKTARAMGYKGLRATRYELFPFRAGDQQLERYVTEKSEKVRAYVQALHVVNRFFRTRGRFK